MHINPFELPQGTKSPSPQKIKFLISLFEGILTDTDADKLPKLSKSLLEEAILKLYETHSHTPKISDFAKLLSDSPEKSLQDFSKMLYPWTGNRPSPASTAAPPRRAPAPTSSLTTSRRAPWAARTPCRTSSPAAALATRASRR
jgi:hypothetical protein